MKKIPFLLSVVLLGFTSCVTIDPPERGTQISVKYIKVNENMWQYNSDGGYYTYAANLNIIDYYIYDHASINVYIDYGNSQQQLPVTRHLEETGQQGEIYRWTRTTDYEFKHKEIHFFVTNSDFVNERPETMLFRVVITWNDEI